MRTIVLQEPGRFRMDDTPLPPEPGEGEALVAVRRVGVCGTDLHAFRGRQPFFSYPRILGHELGVEVVAVGPGVSGIGVGDRCAVEPYLNCGDCIACRRGRPNCCVELRVLGVHTDGGMRERIVVPAAKLHRSERLSLEQLALVETLGIGAHAVARAQVEPGEFALVVGAGPIGLSVLQFLQLAGARAAVADVNEERLAFAREQLRAEQTLAAGDDLPERLAALAGDLPTLVFDATGNAASMRASFDRVAHGGRLVLVGLVLDEISFRDPDFHRKELTVLSSRNSTGDDFRRIIAQMEAGTLDTRPWITHRAPCDGMIDRFPTWLDPGERVIKAVVEF